ncbi:MAG: hypothetical protein FWC19_04550 [Treponema sp.]|nr:hypothetical protein [Treponema sp.]MCL2272060.1 hypothetical protein [Treponema sp.]
MKRLVIFLLACILTTGAIFAQDKAERPERQREVVTIDGIVKLEKGMVAVESGDSVFVVPVLNRYINFINGLKEGAKISVEGNAFKNFIMPKKVTIEGKTYDLASGIRERMGNFNFGFNQRNNNFGRGHFGPGHNFGPQKNMPQKNNMPNRRDNPRTGGCKCDIS